jgi:hypothetical protein
MIGSNLRTRLRRKVFQPCEGGRGREWLGILRNLVFPPPGHYPAS